jgi:serine/threonine protein kinase/tetratricopeptide (TPR) repeat protein
LAECRFETGDGLDSAERTMADADVSQVAGLVARLLGFRLESLRATGDRCWFRGQADGGGESLLVRRIDNIPFAAAVRDLAPAIDLFESCPSGMAAPLAIAVSRDGRIVAGSAAATSGFEIAVDPAAAQGVDPEAAVDVWAFYRDEGAEALADAAADPRAAAGRLNAVAALIDRLAAGHGAIDSPALRFGPAGPLVLGFGLSSLEAVRRERLDQPGPWLWIAPERCLPPGLATAPGDQYALAALWMTARTARPPHGGDTAEAVVRSKLSDPPGLGGLDAAEQDVVARALAARAEDRFESCAAFTAALLGSLGTAPAPAPHQAPVASDPEPIPEPPAKPTQPDTRPGCLDVTAPMPPAVADPGEAQEQLVIPAEPGPPPGLAAGGGVAGTGIAPPLATGPYKPGDLILPGYRLERLLGKGGFGEVWKAAAPGGLSVAIKVIGNLGRKEGAREFRALRTVKNVHHAHIVPIFGVWLKTADGRLLDEEEAILAGERILQGHEPAIRKTVAPGDGGALDSLELVVAMGLGDRTLYDALQARDPDSPSGLEPLQLLEWMRQAALAIDHFNRGSVRDGTTTEAVQHCDIKPQNMLLVGNVVQVCDFGLARVQGQARATANNLLSIAYAAPEMMVKPFNPSPSTDQYSLAVSYYELRTGRLPYGDQPESSSEEISAVELMRAKTDGAVELGLVPPLEQRVLLRALALDPVDRFGSCEELVDRLESAVEMDRKPQRPPAPFPWVRAGFLAGGGVLATVLVAWMLLLPKTPPPEQYLPKAKAELTEAVTPEGIDQGRVEQAAELALEASVAGEDPDACRAIGAAAQAVLRAIAAIPAIRDDGTEIVGLSEAETAVGEVPDSVAGPHRVVLENDLGKRKQEVRAGLEKQVAAAFEAAVRDDGGLDSDSLEAAAAAAGRLARLDPALGERLGRAAEAIREISAVITAGQPEPAGLDAAVASLHRGSADFPQSTESRLNRGLARKIVGRAVARLNDNDLRSPEAPVEGRKRALEDSVKDLEAALKLDPGSWPAHDRLGLCESLRGRHSEAIEAYGKALGLLGEQGGPDGGARADVLRRRAYALAQAKRYGEAAADYVAVADQAPRVCTLLWELKQAAEEAKLYPDAAVILDHLDSLLTHDPDCCPPEVDPLKVTADRAWLLACGFGDDPAGRAVPVAKALIDRVDTAMKNAAASEQHVLLPTRLNALDTLACAYARAGDFAAAMRTIDEVLALVPVEAFQQHRERFERQQAWDQP